MQARSSSVDRCLNAASHTLTPLSSSFVDLLKTRGDMALHALALPVQPLALHHAFHAHAQAGGHGDSVAWADRQN